jgi:hypothetical protein
MCSGGRGDKMLVNFAASQIELGGVAWSNWQNKGTRPHPQNWNTYTLVKQGNKVGLFINGMQHIYESAQPDRGSVLEYGLPGLAC